MIIKQLMRNMPFGKHRDKPLNEIPKGYLRWVLNTCTLNDALRRDIQCVLNGDPLPPTEDELLDDVFRQYT
jgi:uncharacterized protein (DUF3820 family)